MNYREAGGPSVQEAIDSTTPDKAEMPEFMREAVAEAQKIIRTIEACRRELAKIDETFGRFINEPDLARAAKQEVLIPLSKAKEAIGLKVNELIQDARKCVRRFPQAVEQLTGPEDVLRELGRK